MEPLLSLIETNVKKKKNDLKLDVNFGRAKTCSTITPKREIVEEMPGFTLAPLCISLRYHTKSSFLDRFLRQISSGLFLLH